LENLIREDMEEEEDINTPRKMLTVRRQEENLNKGAEIAIKKPG